MTALLFACLIPLAVIGSAVVALLAWAARLGAESGRAFA